MTEIRVVATAGHVDHGKSSLILRLTGMDPDRWEEEKRRGLTIDLGYAWCELPSGREIGFVDVPGHERFIANMLAGVGPVRLVLFVVAANEGWRQQSEEHLAILDVLGVEGGVVALTKQDLVDAETLDLAEEQIRERLEGTALERARLVRVSATTGDGLDELRVALDDLLAAAVPPPETRARLFVDRVFTISGAGTVVTGTLGGSALAVGDDVELYPHGRTARVRSLQTHKRDGTRALPVARVAANLAGTGKGDLARGDVVGAPGAWRPTTTFDGVFRPVRGLAHPVTGRGAFKVYVGAAEADARVRILGRGSAGGRRGRVRAHHDDPAARAGRLRSVRPPGIGPPGNDRGWDGARSCAAATRGIGGRAARPARRGGAPRAAGDPRRRAGGGPRLGCPRPHGLRRRRPGGRGLAPPGRPSRPGRPRPGRARVRVPPRPPPRGRRASGSGSARAHRPPPGRARPARPPADRSDPRSLRRRRTPRADDHGGRAPVARGTRPGSSTP